MFRRFTYLATVGLVFGPWATTGYGQLDGLYEFDGGGDGTSWDEAANWQQVLDADGNPISGNPAAPPDAMTSADIPLTSVLIDSTMPGQTAQDVNIGTGGGVGSLIMSGGALALRDLNAGADGSGANAGSLEVSGGMLTAGDDITVGAGSVGTMVISGGTTSSADDFNINADSSASVTDGTIHIGDRLNMLGNASLLVDGGEVIADDDFFFFEDSQITVNSGLLEVADKLRFDDDDTRSGKLTINGGVVRSNEFGVENATDLPESFRGVVEINGAGVYQVEAPDDPGDPITQLSVAQALDLIREGVHFITSEPSPLKLGVQTVVVPEFDGRQDVVFTQISVVPEPASLVSLALALIGVTAGRRTRV